MNNQITQREWDRSVGIGSPPKDQKQPDPVKAYDEAKQVL